MAKSGIQPRRSIRSSNSGFTLVELLVAAVVSSVVVSAALSITTANRYVYDTDQVRTSADQNLRTSLDILGSDIRQAGEFISGEKLALEIVNGVQGSTTLPADRLIIRRDLLGITLPVCNNINGNDINVADNSGSGECKKQDNDSDGNDDRIEAWQKIRQENGNSVEAYIYNSETNKGEFFTYINESFGNSRIQRDSADNFEHNYEENSRIMLMEQRQYALSADYKTLQMTLNEDLPRNVALVRSLSFEAKLAGTPPTVAVALNTASDLEKTIAVEVTLEAETKVRNQPAKTRTLSDQFFPRNLLSE